jgi:prepilin-type N-terminal cleavage/methylation domain-containing protein
MIFLYKSINKKGFTLIELLVVLSIIGVLASIVLSSINTARAKARDAKRIQSVRQIQIALDIYRDQYGSYPDSRDCNSWDSNEEGGFLPLLQQTGFLGEVTDTIKTPFTCTTGGLGNFSYFKYSTAWTDTGCPQLGKGAWYVLRIHDMETTTGTHSASPGFSCSGRNWGNEGFEYVTGRFEN